MNNTRKLQWLATAFAIAATTAAAHARTPNGSPPPVTKVVPVEQPAK